MNWLDDATPQDLYEAGITEGEYVRPYGALDEMLDYYFRPEDEPKPREEK